MTSEVVSARMSSVVVHYGELALKGFQRPVLAHNVIGLRT